MKCNPQTAEIDLLSMSAILQTLIDGRSQNIVSDFSQRPVNRPIYRLVGPLLYAFSRTAAILIPSPRTSSTGASKPQMLCNIFNQSLLLRQKAAHAETHNKMLRREEKNVQKQTQTTN